MCRSALARKEDDSSDQSQEVSCAGPDARVKYADEGEDDKRSPHPHDSPLAGGKNWRRSLAAQLQDSFRCLKPG